MITLDPSPPAVTLPGAPQLRTRLGGTLTDAVAQLSLVLAELTHPVLFPEAVRATAAGRTRTGVLHLRQWSFPVASGLHGGGLLLAASEPSVLGAAGILPGLLAALVDAELARHDAERARDQAEAATHAALRMANVDALTGLGNRRAWVQALRQECSRASRGSGDLAVVVLDIDGLKAVNDAQGHAAGDELISRTAQALARASRTTDVVCRLGGDEFGVAAPGTSVEQASVLVDRITGLLALEGVRASVGVAVSASCAGGPDELWQRADTAMYAVKRARTSRS